MPIEGSYGIDYLIGDEACLGKGIGKEMIKALMKKIFSFSDAHSITADIDDHNRASKNVLLSCDFVLFDSNQSRYVVYKG